ncbi:MAG: Calx-beta domain-containing protein, partial [Anaerolineae bacterium]
MTKNTFLIPWAAAFLLLLVAGLFSNNGPALAQEPSNQPINLLPDPLTATLKDNLENEALAAEVGDQLTYVTELSVNPIPIGNQKIEPVYEIVYQLDADETVTVSSVYDTTPIAYDDTYFLPSATDFQILASDGLLASGSLNSSFKETLAADQDFDQTQAVSVLAETVTTDFAKITIGVDGSFTYSLFDSTLGVPSADYFSYTISDDEGNQDTGSVILQFNHQRIFFVDSEAETAGNGLLESPFQQLDAALAAADSTCDVIFLLSSATPYDIDHVELLDCQKLIGQDYAPYSFAQISGLDVGAVPVASANNRPIIRCAQSVDYLTGIDPTEMFPTTSQGCIELAQDNVVAGITVDNPDPIQKAIAGENFSTFLGFNITALNSDGFSFSCNDSAAHEVKLTDSIRVQSYGFIGIDLAAFPTSPLTQEQCVLEGDLANVSVVDAAAAAHEAVYAISQSAAYLSLKIDQFEASNIAKSVIRATANDSSTLSLEVTNAQMSDFDMVGVAVENYVFWPLAGRERGLFASVTDSVMVPNTNGRGILANSQGNVASDLKFSNNEIGQVGVRSDGIVVYGNNNGAVNAIINDNLLLSRGAPNPNLPTNQTHAPHMPLYFESNMPDAVGCLAIAGNQAPAGFNYAYGLETASLGLKAGNNGELRIEGWNGQNGQSGVSQLIQENNVELLGGTEIILSPGGEISGGLCDPISIPVKPVLNTAADLSQLTVDVAGPEVIIPVLPPGKTVTIQMTAVVNELAEGLDRVSAQGAYTVDGLNQSHLTLDPNPPAGFEDANGRTVTPLLLISEPVPDLLVSDVVVAEDVDQATITVQLSEAASQDIQIDYATVAGTALAGSDYVETNGQITFPAGSVSQSFQVVIIDDVVTEADEQFAVSFSAVAGMPVTIPDSTSQIAILANDAVIVVPTLIVTDATVSEDAGSISIELTLSEPSATAVGIAYLSANGSAVAGSDFAAVSGEVVFAPGETAATIVISIIDDAVSEADEQFSVNVSATAGSSVLIPDSTIAVTIQDNDDAPVPNLS